MKSPRCWPLQSTHRRTAPMAAGSSCASPKAARKAAPAARRQIDSRIFVVNCGKIAITFECGRLHTITREIGCFHLPNRRCGSSPNRDSQPDDTFQNVQRMAVLRRLMEDLFNKNCSLHDPLMISLSSELDDLVVLEMRKRSRTTKSPR